MASVSPGAVIGASVIGVGRSISLTRGNLAIWARMAAKSGGGVSIAFQAMMYASTTHWLFTTKV